MKLFVIKADMQRFDSRAAAIRHALAVLENLEAGREFHRRQRALRTSSLNIINEAALIGGENVGGSTAASTAPEVAADDDDGGDADPEPERRRTRKTSNPRNTLPSAAEHFDRLPDSACVDIAVLKGVTGKSRSTLYRWIDKGILPKPRKLGLTNNVWLAGEIRRALSA